MDNPSGAEGGADIEARDPRALFDVRTKVAVITGGSGVLGQAMGHALAQAGARVVIIGRRQEACERVASAIRAANGEAMALGCDVLDRVALERAAVEVGGRFGPVDILVNAAGGNDPQATTTAGTSFFELDLSAMRSVFELNLEGTIQCCQVFGQGMARRGGSIVNIASMAALRPLTRVVAYSSAKAAVLNFTQWLAVHLAREYGPGMRVNALAPGFFLSDQNRYLLFDPTTGEALPRGEAILQHTPMGRMGTPSDLVGALLWLASPASAFVTGIVVPVDGGFSAYSGV
jgi:NAD(P)-dependent dehydrogenase (short-subunit alcohol dehydrogenase family)